MGFDELYKEWDKKITTMAHRSNIPGYDPDDIVQELSIIFLKCFQTYNPSMGNKFSTLFYTAARNKLMTMFSKATIPKRQQPLGCISMEEAEEVPITEAFCDVEFTTELARTVKDKQIVNTIGYIIKGGDMKKVSQPVLLKVTEYASGLEGAHNGSSKEACSKEVINQI